MCEPRRLTTLWASMAYYRDSFTFSFKGVRGVDLHIFSKRVSVIYVYLVHISSEWLNLYSDWLRVGTRDLIPGRRTDFCSLLSVFSKNKTELMISLCGLSACIFFFFYSCCFHLEHRTSVKRFVSLQFLNLRQWVGLLDQPITRPLTQTQNKRTQTFMP
jgi:hypothetical protein